MDRLVAFLQPYGLVPPVVMGFPGITVGGGFSGTSGESSSFRHGFFDRTVLSIEIILANGDVLTASPDTHPDLFFGAAASLGTLGVTTLLQLRLVPSSFWVELTYHPVTSAQEALEALASKSTDPSIDYLDAILYSAARGVVVAGRRHNSRARGPVVRFTRADDPWFYLHAERAPAHSTDATPLADYLFRHDRGAFWTGRDALAYFRVPCTALTRCLLDWFMRARVLHHALHASGLAGKYIIQDLAVPASRAPELLAYADAALGIYPLRLCPVKGADEAGAGRGFHPLGAGEMLVSVGVWGPGPRSHGAFVARNREIEASVALLGGRKWLCARRAYYTGDEFWALYDRESYQKLRGKWHAEGLPSVFDKVGAGAEEGPSWVGRVVMGVWPVSGLYGVFRAVVGGSYLVERGPRGLGSSGSLAGLLAVVGVLVALFSAGREQAHA